MSNELAVQEKSKSLFEADKFPHWMNVANQMAKSTMVPKNYIAKPMDILIAWEMGAQVGLSKMQSLQNIAVINGRPSIYGDGLPAICMSHSSYEYMKEEAIMDGKEVIGYKCTAKRKHHEPITAQFTIDDAKKAGLWGKQGPWSLYPNRMMQLRARGFALRDAFPDALQGIDMAEEVQDMKIIEGNVMPSKQADKANYLLNKRGQSNEARNADIETIDCTVNSVIDVATGEILGSNPSHAVEESTSESSDSVVEDIESNHGIKNAQNEASTITSQQLESIDFLLHDKGLDKARQLKALYHFNVVSFADLSELQGDEMIFILNKIESKV